MKYLHEHELRLAHLDLKLENLLLTREGDLLLSDFGLSRAVGEAAGERGS